MSVKRRVQEDHMRTVFAMRKPPVRTVCALVIGNDDRCDCPKPRARNARTLHLARPDAAPNGLERPVPTI